MLRGNCSRGIQFKSTSSGRATTLTSGFDFERTVHTIRELARITQRIDPRARAYSANGPSSRKVSSTEQAEEEERGGTG